ncbi:histidinol dehydrogenase [Candidatus Epulonipiscioides gigas]|nr:histidinol dehydrogenase [Epulopiscium sp. SCG-C07WGA-EpuloA2]
MIRIVDKYTIILEQDAKLPEDIEQTALSIINEVKEFGDEALFKYAKEYDKAELKSLIVSDKELKEAYEQIDDDLLAVIKRARENIENFHKRQISNGFIMEKNGVILGQKVTPIERVGIYIPGGRAVYPSSVLMNVIPAKIAGCQYISVVTPPRSDGTIAKEILAICYMLGVDKVYKIGGAGAIAALAYGTKSVLPVYMITGPGNAYVAAAKKYVFGKVGIDMIAGPSEILIIADQKQNARIIAADMLSQAEHDPLARCILLITCKNQAEEVAKELERQLHILPKEEIARKSIENEGLIVICDTLEECFNISNNLAPEHLELMLDDAMNYLSKVHNAGSIFLGRFTPEPVGDYYAGVNHTLPTNQTAKFSSALSVDTFIKKSTFVSYTQDALANDKDDIILFAKHEGLDAHARSVENRFLKE